MWQLEYLRQPYLRHLEDSELNQRFDDLAANAVQLTPGGLIGAVSPVHGTERWLRLSSHTLVELRQRGLQPDARAVEDSQQIVGADREAAAVLSEVVLPKDAYLVKFGKAQHLRPLRERGAVYLSPATGFDCEGLTPGQRDHELRIKTRHHTWRARTDYLCWALTSILDTRLFKQFNADACLLIREPDRVLARVRRGLRAELPGWTVLAQAVEYIDPVENRSDRPNVYLSKHLRYAYQREVRVVAVPPEPRERLAPLELEIGGLVDMAELIELPEREASTAL